MARKQVTFVGTNGMGQVAKNQVNPAWGVVASGTTGTGTALAVRALSKHDKNSELIGMGVGMATGVAMMLSERMRAAGFAGVLTALITNGLRFAESMFSAKQQIKDLAGSAASHAAAATPPVPLKNQLETAKAAAAAAGLGMVQVNPMPLAGAGLGAMEAQRVPTLGAVSVEPMPLAGQGGGLGIVSPEVIRTLSGAGDNSRPTMNGQMGQAEGPVQIVGNQGIAGNYGATIFG